MQIGKEILLLVLLICAVTLHSAAQAVSLNTYIARSEGANVLVQWEIQDEAGVSEYKLARKIDQNGSFETVFRANANGTRYYQFMDDHIFKNENRVITYELQVVKAGISHAFYTSISHNPTAVQRTWGSIKAMFN